MRALAYLVLAALPLLFGLAIHAPGLASATIPATQNAAGASVAAAPPVEATVGNRVADAERRALILEARSELEDSAYARLEVLMAVFASLITVLVVGFGIATYRTAANAARAELANVKKSVEDLQREAEAATKKAVRAAESADESAMSAEGAAEKARTHERSAQEDSKIVKAAALLVGTPRPLTAEGVESSLSPAEQQTVSDAAKEVGEKDEAEWSVDEFKVKIEDARTELRWDEMLRLARGMEFLHGRKAEVASYALFQQAQALSGSGREDEALGVFRELIDRFKPSENPAVQKIVARSLFNKGTILKAANRMTAAIDAYKDLIDQFGNKPDIFYRTLTASAMYNQGTTLAIEGRWRESIAVHDDLISRFDPDDDSDLQDSVARAMVAKGNSLREVGPIDEAIAATDVAISRFAGHREPQVREWVTMARWNKALMFASQAKIRDTIEALDEWERDAGRFDCALVAESDDFDSIRNSPVFVRYLKRKGCSV